MPDLTAPLLSLDASGTIAKTLTYSRWRGIKYARQRVVPTNPNTTSQQHVRSCFAYLSDLWKYGPTALHQTYLLAAKGRPLTDRNLFTKTNQPYAFANATDEQVLASPSTGGAPAPANLVLTPHSTHIGVNLWGATLPPGWTTIAGWAIAWHQETPTTHVFVPPIAYDTDADPTLLDITGLTNGVLYVVSAYLEFADATGKTQYSIALNDTATPA